VYLTFLKAMIVEAVKNTFDDEYPVTQFRNVWTSIEYPIKQQNYPGIWVDYEDARPLQIAGIDHKEIDPDGRPFTRWKFAGHATFTVVAFSSQERDALYDEMVRVIAFGRQNAMTDRFRSYIEGNDLIACNFDFDTIQPGGNAAAPGTPWGSDEVIYEKSFSMQALGEFVVDPENIELVPLSAIIVTARTGGTEDDPENPQTVTIDQNASDDPNYPVGTGLGEWH
jgi:hypothetical protein